MKNRELSLRDFIKRSKVPILITLFFLLLFFGIRLISNSFSIDTEFYINHYKTDWNWWLGLNRWGLVFINNLLSIGPLVIFQANFMTMVFILGYSILFSYLFYLYIPDKFKDKYLKYQFIFPIIFITSPIFAEQYNFTNQNVAVSLAICLYAISLILFHHADKLNKGKRILINIIALAIAVLAFGVYQSIVPSFILVVACIYFLECLRTQDNSWKFLGNMIIKFLIIGIIYFIISKIIGGENSYLQTGWSSSGLLCFKNIYNVIISALKCDTIFYNASYLIAIVMMVGINIYLFVKKKNNFGIVISSIGILLAPFYIIFITGVDQLKRTQFNYSFVIGFIFLIAFLFLITHKKVKYVGYFVMILALGIAYKQSVITGTLFYSDSVRFENDTILATKIQNKIEEKDWYDSNEDYTLVILGNKPCSAVNCYLQGEVMGHSFFAFDYQYVYGPSQRANAFMKTLGYNYNIPTEEEFTMAKKYAKSKHVDIFPSSDSIVKKGDVIIVRLSNEM